VIGLLDFSGTTQLGSLLMQRREHPGLDHP